MRIKLSSASCVVLALAFMTLLAPPTIAQDAAHGPTPDEVMARYTELRDAQDWSGALNVLRDEIDDPGDPSPEYLSAIRLLALRMLAQAMKFEPNDETIDAEAERYVTEGTNLLPDDDTRQAQLIHALGVYYSSTGRNGLAVEQFEKSLSFWEKTGDTFSTILALASLASTEADRGSYEAEAYLRGEALRLAEEYFVMTNEEATPEEWLEYSNLLMGHLDMLAAPGNREELVPLVNRVQMIDRFYLAPNTWFLTSIKAAEYFALCGAHEDAQEHLERARELAKQFPHPQADIDIASSTAHVAVLAGRYQEALDIWEWWKREAENIGLRPTIADFRIKGIALEGLGRYQEAGEAYVQGVLLAEELRESYPVEDRAKFFRSIVREPYWGLIRCAAQRAISSGKPKDVLDAMRATEMLRARQLGELVGDDDPVISAERMEQFRENLAPGQLVLSYIVTDRQLLLFLLTRDDSEVFAFDYFEFQIYWESLKTKQKCAESPVERFWTVYPGNMSMADFLAYLPADIKTLKGYLDGPSEMFTWPVGEWIAEADELILMTDGPISALPFAAMTFKDQDEYDPIVKHCRIRTVPSLRYLMLEQEDRPEPGDALFAIGDPIYTPSVVDSLMLAPDAHDSTARARQYLVNANRMEETRREVESIAALFEGRDNKLLFEREAKESAVKSLPMDQYGYLHFSTHGMLGDVVPGIPEPAVLCCWELGEDGFLTASEVEQLNLNARVTVLSACQTGDGEYFRGEGVMGIGRSFLVAGSQTAIVSLWSVDLLGTEALLVRFYKHLMETDDAATALRRAELDLLEGRDQARYVHPYYWAPFIAFGR